MNTHPSIRYATRLSYLASLMITLAVPAWAEDPGCSKQINKNEVSEDAAGQMAHVDPATGKLIPVPIDPSGEGIAMKAEGPREPLVQEVRPNGTVVADISGRFDTALVAEIVDGNLVTCHQPIESPEKPSNAIGEDHDR